MVPSESLMKGDVSAPLGLLAKHSLLRLSGLYKFDVELHDYGSKPSSRLRTPLQKRPSGHTVPIS